MSIRLKNRRAAGESLMAPDYKVIVSALSEVSGVLNSWELLLMKSL